MKNRATGFLCSGRMLPLTKTAMSAGTSVTARMEAAAIENVLVSASGRNMRPSTCSSVNTGRKLTVTIRSEKNSDGPTSFAASMTARTRSPSASWGGSPLAAPSPEVDLFASRARSMCLCAFSTMTSEASTITPMAMAIPPRLMMLALMPRSRMAPSAIRMPTGTVTTATNALRTWSRNTMTTSATTRSSSQIVVVSAETALAISSERSYSVTTSTPGGKPSPSSAIRALTASMVAWAFSPERMTTMPPTTSPWPFTSAMPRRISGPSRTSATWPTVTGVPPSARRTTWRMSSMPWR